jgi:hypothetical protein
LAWRDAGAGQGAGQSPAVSKTNNWRLLMPPTPDFVEAFTLKPLSYQKSVKNPDCE